MRNDPAGAALAPRSALAAIAAAFLLAGCALVGGEKEPVAIYAPVPRVAAQPDWPVAPWQHGITPPHPNGMMESPRIAVRCTSNSVSPFSGPSRNCNLIGYTFADRKAVPSVVADLKSVT